ncbi:MAG: hypothetical protein ACP5HK_04270 [Acidilobus sp.]
MEPREIAREIAIGIIEGLIYILLYVYLLPALISYLGVLSGQQALKAAYSYPMSYVIMYIGLFEALSVSARIFRQTVFSPIFRSLLALLGLVIVLYILESVMPGGVITASYALGQARYSFTLSVYPLVLLFLVFLVLPGIILPFVDYFIYGSGD